ncbi:MAG: hypothetical protein ABIM74_07895 [candidate division WOR-3 bacterium]
MKRFALAIVLAFLLVSCEETIEKIPRTTVVVSVGSAGPALNALLQLLPSGLQINPPADWDTLSLETAMAGVLVDGVPCDSATVNVAGTVLPYDSTTGLYAPIDTNGLPIFLQLGAGDPITVYSPHDTVTGVVPECPDIVSLSVPDSHQVNTAMNVSWSYSAGNPDSVMITFKIHGRNTYTKIIGGQNTSYVIPSDVIDTTGLASVSVSSLVIETDLAGATPGSFIIYNKSDFSPVVIY